MSGLCLNREDITSPVFYATDPWTVGMSGLCLNREDITSPVFYATDPWTVGMSGLCLNREDITSPVFIYVSVTDRQNRHWRLQFLAGD
ncbi:hypothetical protein DPMN_137102 [Dreissena polymorpha]|uniref:Uncharacterized protein n=1 Tax=Dreissena polymorpha TaxID=45954 RepID=A0A9D4JG59_DREPO|nr:hypothetical protein DPMN_137102 [Dreissena polymorpha]